MHVLISESSQVPNIALTVNSPPNATTPTIVLSTPWLRPRLQGNRGALRGDAFNAKAADFARVQFTVRLPAKDPTGNTVIDRFNNYQAVLTVEQSPLLDTNPESAFASDQYDVSGAFAVEGRIAVDVAIYGTCRATLTLVRRTNPTGVVGTLLNLFTLTQVFAEQWTLDVTEDGKLRGEG
jgi:hypothetical protein